MQIDRSSNGGKRCTWLTIAAWWAAVCGDHQRVSVSDQSDTLSFTDTFYCVQEGLYCCREDCGTGHQPL